MYEYLQGNLSCRTMYEILKWMSFGADKNSISKQTSTSTSSTRQQVGAALLLLLPLLLLLLLLLLPTLPTLLPSTMYKVPGTRIYPICVLLLYEYRTKCDDII